MMVNFSVVYELSPFDVQVDVDMNQANAATIADDHRMEQQECWITGRMIDLCKYNPSMICDTGAQGSCSIVE